jgi:CheY-like chemotaxis protein
MTAGGQKIISDTLRRDGYEIFEAADGAQAMELLEHRSFDLIISDVVMPNMDGLKLLDHIRRVFPRMPVCPVTFSTSQARIAYWTKQSFFRSLSISVCSVLWLVALFHRTLPC